MAIKFANIVAAMKMVTGQEPVTEAHLEAADAEIAQLKQAKLDAEGKLATAEASLTTATDELTKTKASLETEKGKVATLEEWKKNQATVDGRESDESNTLDEKPEAQEAWEKTAASAIAGTKKRLNVK